jgi:(p)ppGpp synthase/HD superfamily hydrolase
MREELSRADRAVLQAVAPIEGTDAYLTLPQAEQELSRAAAKTLACWRVPAYMVAAALGCPLLEHGISAAEALAQQLGPEAARLSQRFVEWRSGSVFRLGAEAATAPPATALRHLFRQVYLEFPSLELILLAMAYHEAELRENQSGWESLAASTLHVGIPLAEMLGMWNLRCGWLERSTHALSPDDYDEMDKLLGESQKRRAETYATFRERLCAVAGEEGIRLRVQPLRPLPAASLYRAQRGEPMEELADRLSVRVLCGSKLDCYAALCLIHGLGKPLDPRFSQRFDDYIASPQPSGYRALHTAIMYRDQRDEMLVELRIVTRAMQRLNELGVVAALYQRPDLYRSVPAWWNRLDELSAQLHRRYGWDQGIQKFMEQHDLGTRSHPLYVFTPRGEIILLPDGSTPLDFAYHIHTQLGHHARMMELNGQTTPYNYPLRNGDLVRVDYDPHLMGPDLSWPGLAATSYAKAKIRTALAKRAGTIHPGRAQLEHVLLKVLQYYKDKKHCDLTVTTGRLDAFLLHIAQLRGFSDVNPLYAQVAQGQLSANKLVRLLISEELAGSLVDASGRPAPYALYRIRFCDNCRPVPGEALAAFERRVGGGAKAVVIHTRACRFASLASGKKVALQWAQASDSEEVFAELEVFAEDRYRVLGDLLEVVYGESGIYLHRASAQAFADGRAAASLTVRARSLQQLSDLQKRMGHIRNVGQVFCYPLRTVQRLALSTPPRLYRPNPYTEHEVHDRWMFLDREAQIDQIVKWLQEPPPTRLLVLHGQRRVGKTSLAQHLAQEVLPHYGIVPAFVDLLGLSAFGTQDIANYLVEAVCRALSRPVPAQNPSEAAVQWASRVLAQVVSEQHGYRLLLLIDEFNVLLDMRNEGHLDPMVFANLRALLNQRRDLNWLLIVHDTYFLDSERWADAGPLFQQATTMAVAHLDRDWTDKLVLEPTKRCGLGCEDALAGKVFQLTAGNPYLTQALCLHMVNQVRSQHRANITADDLARAAHLVISDGYRYFNHFTGNLSSIAKIVLTAIADASTSSGEWVNVSWLSAQLTRRCRALHPEAAHNAMDALERQGAIAVRNRADSAPEEVCIPIDLFRLWLRQCYTSNDTAIEEWQSSNATGSRKHARRASNV